MDCASCSEPLPDGANFCPSCGAPVVTTAGEERRIVTVLFADIVGYTGLVEYLDPERAKRLVDDAFERLIADIVEFGGRVDKVLGDGILALFGAPVAHEDDPDRAIRAALQMHESLAAFVEEHDELERAVELRVGINTGEVLVGRVGGTDDYTAMGDVVNVASRLQSLAPPGGVFIGDATAKLASAAILREPVDEVTVRGREQLEHVWKVTGRQRNAPGRPNRRVPLVGRVDERELLTSIMHMVLAGRSAVVAVSGEAGVGKTRFVTEVLDSFRGPKLIVFAAACAPYGEANVWAPIVNALFGQLDGDTSSTPEVLRGIGLRKGVELYGFAPGDPVLDWFVEGALYLGGHPSRLDHTPPAQAREMLFRLVVEALRRRSNIGPVVLWIDDLQWADQLVMDLLHRVTRSLVDRPMLVLTAQRDDADIDWPPTNDQSVIVRTVLEPLSRDEAGELVTHVLGEVSDENLAGRLYERSGGNPLFLTELAELALAHPGDDDLPRSLHALIASRLDRLAPSVRAIIDNAAVLGASGPVESLQTFALKMHQPFSRADIAAVEESGLLHLEGGGWRFRSDLVREVAYQTLTKRVRAFRHAGTAAAMEDLGAPIDRIAHHAASAAELVAEIGSVPDVPDDIAGYAIAKLEQAANRSLETGAFSQALRQATRALELEPDDAALERRLRLLRSSAATERREVDKARVDALAVLDSAREAGDRHDEGVARRLIGSQAQIMGDLPTARRELGASVAIFRELGDDLQLARSLADLGYAETFGGSLREADMVLTDAEALAERLGDRRLGAWVREHHAWVAFLSGDAKEAEVRLDHAAAEFDELGDRAGRNWARALRAYLYYFDRRFAEAETLAEQVRQDSIELGDRWAPAMMDSLLASIRLWSGEFAEAEELSSRALAAFRHLGDRFGIVQALGPNTRALVALGRAHDAERGIEEGLALSDSFGDLAFPVIAAAGAGVHLGLGDRAVVLAESAMQRMTSTGAAFGEVPVTLALGLCQVERPDDAMATLVDVQVDFPYAHSVRALAAAMVGGDDQALADAEAVQLARGASYLDRVIADVAGAAVVLHAGDRAAGEARLARALDVAVSAGDVVAEALARSAATALLGDDGSPVPLGVGWRRVLAVLAARVSPVPS